MALWFELKVNVKTIKVIEIVRTFPTLARPLFGETCTYRYTIYDGPLVPGAMERETTGTTVFPYGVNNALPLVQHVLTVAGCNTPHTPNTGGNL